MKMRGVPVDHATIQRWVFKFTPLLESEMKKRKGKVGTSWRMDETYIKVKGIWCYLYRAVDKLGNPPTIPINDANNVFVSSNIFFILYLSITANLI
jgi:transposase-like protein